MKKIELYRNAWPMNSDSPTTVRRGYFLTSVPATSDSGVWSRWLTVICRSAFGRSRCTDRSMPVTIRSASSSFPWMNSQRGLSGTSLRISRMPMPRIAPSPNSSRHPMSSGSTSGLSSGMATSAPKTVPSQ